MNDLTLENIQQFLESAAKANADAWASQTSYFEDLVKRNTECFAELGEARVASLKEMSEAKTFNQAFESNLAFDEKVREDLAALQESNIKAWESLMEQLKDIYVPAEATPAKKSRAKKAA
jgi:DNA-binding transcriptional regulator YbjK